MGTNYYATVTPCEHCGRDDGQVHIGKNKSIIQGYSVDSPSPWGPILSWADWRRVLREHQLHVVDEYGHTHDTEKFIAETDAVEPEHRRKSYDWSMGYRYSTPGADLLDAEGFSVHLGDFS